MKISHQFLGTKSDQLRSGASFRYGHPVIFNLSRLARAGLCCLFLLASLALQGQECFVNTEDGVSVCFDEDGTVLMGDLSGDFDDGTFERTRPAGFDIESFNNTLNNNVVSTEEEEPCDEKRWEYVVECVGEDEWSIELTIYDAAECGGFSFSPNANVQYTVFPSASFTGGNVIITATITGLSSGDDFCWDIDYSVASGCCDFEACVELPDCCDNRWEYVVECVGEDEWSIELTIFGAAECGGFSFSPNANVQYTVFPSASFTGGNVIITATITGLSSGDDFCWDIDYPEASGCCDFEACVELPDCCDNRWEYVVECVGEDEWSIELTIFGAAECGGFSFSPNANVQYTVFPSATFTGGNVIITATITGLSAGDDFCWDIDYSVASGCCDFEACVELPECCDNRWEYVVECVGEDEWSFELTIFDAAECGGFGFSPNAQYTVFPSVAFTGGNVIITATVTGLSPGDQLCLNINYPDGSGCCDFEACTDPLPRCCETPDVRIVDVECDRDSLAEVSYTIDVEIEDPNDWVLDGINVSSACGTASVVSLVDQGNTTLATISLTNVTAEEGDECCLELDFVNVNLCDTSVCFIIEECPCYVDLEVDFPPCITPGEEFEVTYTFDYQGDPSTGVNALWTVFNQDPGNPWQIVDGDVQPVVNFGFNTHTITLVYNGECEPPGSTDLTVLAFFYTSTGIECCSIVDTHSPECCCECDVTLTYCSEQEELEELVKIMSTDRRYKDDKLAQEFVQRFTSRTKEDGCGDKECCYICEEPFFLGPILAKVEGCDFDENPDNYTFLWNTGQTTQAIIGTSIGNPVYSVTVTNVVTGCEYTAEIEIICDEEVREQDRFVEKRNDTNPDASVEQAEGIELKAYPVPADDLLTISSTALIGQDVYLTNTLGRVMLSNQNVQTEKLVLDVSDFATGMYIIQVKDKDGKTIDVRKVLIVD